MGGFAASFCVGLLVLITAAPIVNAQRRDRDRGGSEIYVPDDERLAFDCTDQCQTFRKSCVAFCKDEGHVPGDREPSDDCAKDCKKMEKDCFDTCTRSMSFSKPPPQTRR